MHVVNAYLSGQKVTGLFGASILPAYVCRSSSVASLFRVVMLLAYVWLFEFVVRLCSKFCLAS